MALQKGLRLFGAGAAGFERLRVSLSGPLPDRYLQPALPAMTPSSGFVARCHGQEAKGFRSHQQERIGPGVGGWGHGALD